MAFNEGGSEGSLNGTTHVDVVAVPGSSTRRLVRNVHICNVDTVAHTITVFKNVAATRRELARETLQPNEYWTFDTLVVLDATDEKMEAVMAAAVTTTAPTFSSAYGDAS